jgi:hypothetical protein
MRRDDMRPTFWGTLAQQWDISRALWRDYWHCVRQARQRAKVQQPFTIHLGHPGRQDTLFWLVLAIAVVCAVFLVYLQAWGGK